MNQTLKCALLASSLSLVPITSHADTADGESLIGKSWDDVTAMARGGEVNWFLWGGSDNINQYVSEFVGGILEDEYDVKLNRVGLSDTVEAVNIVLGEKESGVLDKGSVDMIWVNGENFKTMKQGDLAYCGYLETLPNNALVDWDNPSIANDFGVPVEGCEVPWSKTQFAFAYDTARTDTPPKTIAELLEWAKANPGKFTYPAPPDFNGSVFVRHVFYHAAGGVDKLLGEFDQATYDEVAKKTWDILNDLEPSLWRDGKTYPATIAAMEQLYANSEVDLTFNYEPAGVGLKIEDGTFPPTTSPNKAAALVLQNVLLSGEAQLQKAMPDVWGAETAIEVSRTSDEIQEKFSEIEAHPNVVPAAELAKAALPELQASWISAIEKGWLENVGK